MFILLFVAGVSMPTVVVLTGMLIQFRMTEEAFILVKGVLLAIWALLVFEFRMAKPATVLIAVMTTAP
jgi:hypothetical protein